MAKSSKTFVVSASIINAENGLGDEPGGIALVIDDDLVANIRHLGEIVKQNGLYRVETFDSHPTWLDGSPEGHDRLETIPESECRVECVTLNVGDDRFWYEGFIKHTDLIIKSDEILIADLSKDPSTTEKNAHGEEERSGTPTP